MSLGPHCIKVSFIHRPFDDKGIYSRVHAGKHIGKLTFRIYLCNKQLPFIWHLREIFDWDFNIVGHAIPSVSATIAIGCTQRYINGYIRRKRFAKYIKIPWRPVNAVVYCCRCRF